MRNYNIYCGISVPILLICSSVLSTSRSFVSAATTATTRTKKFSPKCKGDTLKSGAELRRNQVIGPDWNCPDGGYRLGLNDEGWLGYWSHGDAVKWWPGVRGDILRMELDGNLVLYDDKANKVWESGCPGGKGAVFQNTGYNGSSGVVVDKKRRDKVLWRISDDGQETRCMPKDTDRYESPEVKCRGSILGPQVRLEREEYLCGPSGHERFGLNAQGKLGLWHGRRLIWAASQLADGQGDYLMLQKSGRLVLYDKGEEDDNTKQVKWEVRCNSIGSILSLKNGGLTLEGRNGDTVWKIDSSGVESDECYPQQSLNSPPDCTRVSNFGDTCKVQMVDRYNEYIVTIQVNAVGNNKYEVIDNGNENYKRKTQKVKVKVKNDGTGKVVTDANVPDVTCIDLANEYSMKDDKQLLWFRDDTFTCNSFAESLIYFMVEEWFYFG